MMTRLRAALAKLDLGLAFACFLVAAGALVDQLAASMPLLVPYLGKWGGLATAAIGLARVAIHLLDRWRDRQRKRMEPPA